MFRGLKNILSHIALVCAILLSILAIRSYYSVDSLYFEAGGRGYTLCAVKGELGVIETARSFSIALQNFGDQAPREADAVGILENALSDDATHAWGVVRFGSGDIQPTSQFTGTLSWLTIPIALPMILLFIPPFIRVRKFIRRKSRRTFQTCFVCGYTIDRRCRRPLPAVRGCCDDQAAAVST